MKKLPKTIYVRIEKPANDVPFLIATGDADSILDGDGPETVGRYQLVETFTLRKVVERA